MKAFLKALLFLFTFTCISYAFEEYECDHDNIEQDLRFLEVEEDMNPAEDDRILAASKFRIYPYYAFLKSTASAAYAAYFQNKLIPPAIDYFEAALKVKFPLTSNLKVGNSAKICERATPQILKTGVATDFFLYFDSYADSSTQIAATKYCYLASGSRRPLIARVNINRNQLKVTSNVIAHEKNMYVMMHEIMHGLGFSSSTYKLFVNANGKTRTGHIKNIKVNGVTRTFVDVPPLTQKLRTHFGCSTLQGALMENGGGSATASSHFERKVFLYEAMTSGSINGRRISELSLAMLEGSGWYTVNYAYAEPFFFGKGKGCSFVTGSTCAFSEFCSGSVRGCAPHGRGGGSCVGDTLTGGCRYISAVTDYDCENVNGQDYTRLPGLQAYGRGVGSRCFTGTLNTRASTSKTSFCFKYTCSGKTLTVQVGTKKITCTQKGIKTIDGYYGSIDCPDPVTFCNGPGKKYCPRNCMGRGTCSNGKCICRSGYKGVDCALNA